jgi:hypothetical protein
LVRELKPENSLEIGLAFGFSTMYFLAAIHANGSGHHVAVDPFQYEWWHGIGVAREKVVGIERGLFEFVQETLSWRLRDLLESSGNSVSFSLTVTIHSTESSLISR